MQYGGGLAYPAAAKSASVEGEVAPKLMGGGASGPGGSFKRSNPSMARARRRWRLHCGFACRRLGQLERTGTGKSLLGAISIGEAGGQRRGRVSSACQIAPMARSRGPAGPGKVLTAHIFLPEAVEDERKQENSRKPPQQIHVFLVEVGGGTDIGRSA